MALPAQGPAAQVLFVCLGNICRSPTAAVVFRARLARLRRRLRGQVGPDTTCPAAGGDQ